MGHMKRHEAIYFVLLALGCILWLENHYPSIEAVLGGLIGAVAIYIVPGVIFRSMGINKPAVVFTILWEFVGAIVTRVIDFPLWSFFLMAGVGGVVVLLFFPLLEMAGWITGDSHKEL
ncbi:hypothetical protein [Thermococcus celer]|uniref:Permease n=1 Tax=Thermococcus celer Vu 13 = JCM 8558 TaxID=1293037 RepID=A0A218P0M5_THECE|nr:hypothetical protein [Thermococcus celer]ASI98487.1 hypothetical protein A3L02_02350 [Thermococcus celer Vu 13 = JCM 8558]ASI99198.1 hypothetical protein A3L02_06285 [Thermococcus celer Vu 13 = JCM 8558]